MATLTHSESYSVTRTDLPLERNPIHKRESHAGRDFNQTLSRAFTGNFSDLGRFWGHQELNDKLVIEFYVAEDDDETTYFVASKFPHSVGMGDSLTEAFGDWCREATEFRERARLVRQPWPVSVAMGVEAFDSWIPFV